MVYTVYGHPWKEELHLTPVPTKDELPLGMMIQVLKAKVTFQTLLFSLKKLGEPEPEISRSPHGTLRLRSRSPNDDPNKVLIKDKLSGKELYLHKDEITEK